MLKSYLDQTILLVPSIKGVSDTKLMGFYSLQTFATGVQRLLECNPEMCSESNC